MDSELICDFILSKSDRRLSQMELNVYVFLINLSFCKKYGLHILKEEFVYYSLLSWYLPYIKEKYKYYGANSIDRPNYIVVLPDDLSTFILDKIKELDTIPYWDLIAVRNNELKNQNIYRQY